MRIFAVVTLSLVLTIILSGCTTRQVSHKLGSSTEQRLITYSIEQMIAELPEQDFSAFSQDKVFVKSHFVVDGPVVNYADQMLRLDLLRRFNLTIVEDISVADVELHVFFTSLATDSDVFGLSIPFINATDTSQSTRIDLLAIDMFHGISEMMYYVKHRSSNQVVKKGKIKARVRTDDVSTPVISFPVSDID